MIRRATTAEIPNNGANECTVRIAALKDAYGCDVSFIQYFTDENGGLLAVMDGVGILSVNELTEEWRIFLDMNPDIRKVHCSGDVGSYLIQCGGWHGEVGEVMRFTGEAEHIDASVCTAPYLPAVYTLLNEYFPNVSPFDYWYPDVSHRIRHQCGHIACIVCGDQVVSTAMAVAETPTEAIIGQVVTNPAFRKKGYASTCIKSVISQCEGKQLYILPLNETAKKLYQNIGFVSCGTWSELEKLY